jgi:hypothetical protein
MHGTHQAWIIGNAVAAVLPRNAESTTPLLNAAVGRCCKANPAGVAAATALAAAGKSVHVTGQMYDIDQAVEARHIEETEHNARPVCRSGSSNKVCSSMVTSGWLDACK